MVSYLDKHSELADLFRTGMRGDQGIYAQFLRSIAPIMARMAARKLPASDIEDVVQEILISVHKSRHTYDGERPIMPWLISIAKFRIADHLRKHYAQNQHQTVDIYELADILPDVTHRNDHDEYIDELLQDVPEHHKRILTLIHVEGYTAKQVAAQIDMNESAVKVAAHRAVKKIREKFVK